MDRKEELRRLIAALSAISRPRISAVRAWQEIERIGKVEDSVLSAYRERFELFPEDVRALRIFFRPCTVPGGMTEDQIWDSINLHDAICIDPDSWSEIPIGEQPLIELYDEIRCREETGLADNFLRNLKLLYAAKMEIKERIRKNGSTAFVDALPLDEQDAFFRKVKDRLRPWL
ncbi:MAG: hypothetical protein KGH93_01535 [Patescibacteria group bacterium]|nr:hypothetical protein [Patescibacteria group bacterium]MDE1945863.1 hypothetical protein [Patescibacteria group bacterium]